MITISLIFVNRDIKKQKQYKFYIIRQFVCCPIYFD